MDWRWDMSPVFAVAMRRSARGWGLYAWRASAVAAAMALPLSVAYSVTTTVSRAEWIGLLPRYLRVAYRMVAGAELVMAFGLAPAMTAGAICDERRRGRLADLLVTDLGAREILLGKLAAGLAGLAMVVGAILPALLLTALLGGASPTEVVAGSFVVMGVASVTASLALLLSIRARRSVEAMTTSAGAALAISLIADSWRKYLGPPPVWIRATNPWALLTDPERSGFSAEWFVFVAGCLAITSAWVAIASWRLRPDGLRERGARPARSRKPDRRGTFASILRAPSRSWDRFDRAIGRLLGMPEPSLDAAPALWRAWRRSESSWMRRVWLAYGVASIGSAILYLDHWWEAQVNGYIVSIGVMLAGVSAATAWDDDRGRDAFLPLLMTPLSSREIVRGAWWGAYRVVPRLALLPALIVLLRGLFWGHPLAALPMALSAGAMVLGYGSVAVGVGLFLGLRQPRSGPAIAWTLALLLLANDAWPWMWSQACGVHLIGADRWACAYLAWVSPWYASYLATAWVFFVKRQPELMPFLASVPAWAALLGLIGRGLRRSIEGAFDRRAGRTADSVIYRKPDRQANGWKARAVRGDRASFDRVLAKVADVEPEIEDRIDPQMTPMNAD